MKGLIHLWIPADRDVDHAGASMSVPVTFVVRQITSCRPGFQPEAARGGSTIAADRKLYM